ncbi:MAG TPA: hypothetical protein V6C88_07030 [Chroococcidiopsis sp.]
MSQSIGWSEIIEVADSTLLGDRQQNDRLSHYPKTLEICKTSEV